MTYWYKEKYPPRSGIGAERLTIDDLTLNDVRVVLPPGDDATMKTFGLAEKRKARRQTAADRREPPDGKV